MDDAMISARETLVPNHRERGLSLAERFDRYVVRRGDDDCWEWIGPTFAGGYGQLCGEGRKIVAHRWAWVQANGAIPEGLHVLHRCDQPPCTNPRHLFLGTKKDNTADAAAKGRLKHGTVRIAHDELVLLFCEGLTYAELAAHFKTDERTVATTLTRIRKHGIHVGRRGHFNYDLARRLAQEGWSSRAIAARVGVSGVAVHRFLRRDGYVARPQGGYVKQEGA